MWVRGCIHLSLERQLRRGLGRNDGMISFRHSMLFYGDRVCFSSSVTVVAMCWVQLLVKFSNMTRLTFQNEEIRSWKNDMQTGRIHLFSSTPRGLT